MGSMIIVWLRFLNRDGLGGGEGYLKFYWVMVGSEGGNRGGGGYTWCGFRYH